MIVMEAAKHLRIMYEAEGGDGLHHNFQPVISRDRRLFRPPGRLSVIEIDVGYEFEGRVGLVQASRARRVCEIESSE